jgi:hypothetical protein
MTLLGVERLRDITLHVVPPIPYGLQTEYDDEILDVIYPGLARSNRRRVEKISKLVRNTIGFYDSGKMWARYDVVLPDHRPVDLQIANDAFIINICPSMTTPFNTHAFWDRKNGNLHTFDVWDPKSYVFLLYYNISESMPCIPATFSNTHAAKAFSIVLDQVNQAILLPYGCTDAATLTTTPQEMGI